MLPKNCGQLLYNAVRETLETMAFAEVIPCSIKVGGEECAMEDDFSVTPESAETSGEGGWGDVPEAESADTWGTAVPAAAPEEPVDDVWETPITGAPTMDDGWGTSAAPVGGGDSWGDPEPSNSVEDDDDWGHKSGIIIPEADPWGDSASLGSQVDGMMMKPKEIDFDDMVENQDDWCWACMKVNSPDIHSVWFIVSKGLANALAQNMYAGEEFQLDNPLIRDLIAELTNVLGGRLMLLLEEMGGEFTLTVPEIGFGMPKIPETATLETVLCKVVVDGEYPVIVALCFNQGGIAAPDK